MMRIACYEGECKHRNEEQNKKLLRVAGTTQSQEQPSKAPDESVDPPHGTCKPSIDDPVESFLRLWKQENGDSDVGLVRWWASRWLHGPLDGDWDRRIDEGLHLECDQSTGQWRISPDDHPEEYSNITPAVAEGLLRGLIIKPQAPFLGVAWGIAAALVKGK
jgi:hypothetical protein